MAAFQAAVDSGADVVELDVQLSADAVAVVVHDERVDRTTSGSGPVRAHSWHRLQELDAGSWFAPRFRGERIPRLADVLSWAADHGTRLLVEVKTSPVFDPGAVPALVDVFGDRERDDVILYSSDHLLVAELAQCLPGIPRGVVVNERTPCLPEILEATRADLLSQSTWCLTPDTVRYCHDTGRLVSAEARYPADVPLLVDWGVDMIVTARTELPQLVEAVARNSGGDLPC
ncbi:glycerophosphodiester phosphodiesterase [Streptomyces chiangmaiensis]